MANAGGKVDLIDNNALVQIENKLHDSTQIEIDAENELFSTRLQHLNKEYELKKQMYAELNQMGLKAETEKTQAARDRIETEKQEKIAEAKAASKGDDKEFKKRQKQIDKEARDKLRKEKENWTAKEKFADAYAQHAEKREAQAEAHKKGKELTDDLFGAGKDWTQRVGALTKAFSKESGGFAGGMSTLVAGLADFAKQLENQIDTIAGKKGAIDTRLQGWGGKKRGGSYWDQLSFDMMGVAGASPLLKQETWVSNLESLISKGISFNVEQRSFLATISDKIATTFNVADGTLLKLIRIQQQDTTATRLGMESALNAFLNNMYETTEYLSDLASSVRSSLDEVESLMGAADAVALEYQVQKWMGSLYSVGMSSNSVSGIARAFGQIAAGDISGLQGGGMGNLMIMAANQAGLSIADILAEGLDDSNTNRLMSAMVDYLAQIAEASSDSRVVQQQLAKVYGLTAADLRAATNLNRSNRAVSASMLNYGGAMSRLTSMANSMYSRTSMGEMMGNVWGNLNYTIANGIASNPAMYMIYKAASLLKDTTGGIDFSLPTYMGTGMSAQTFNIADLMRVAAMSGGILSGIGSMLGNLSAGGGFSPSGMLKALGIKNNLTTVSRGSGKVATAVSGGSYSESGSMVGNSNSEDVQNSTMTGATDSAKSQVAEAKEEEEQDLMNKDLNNSILQIYDLLQSITTGATTLKVETVEGTNSWTNPLLGKLL